MLTIRTKGSLVAASVAALVLGACGGTDDPPPPPGVIELDVGEAAPISSPDVGTIEVSGGSGGAEFVLVPFYGLSTTSANIALEFTGTQITGVTGPPTPQVEPSGGPRLSRVATTEALAAAARFDGDLRRMERDVFAPRMGAARAAFRARRSSSTATPSQSSPLFSGAAAPVPAIGDQMTLNTERSPACSVSPGRTGRVVAITQRTVIVADNANPSGGFTDAEYLEIAQEFDATVFPVVTQNFGTPGDIDANVGRAVIFYTRAVNELTPAGSDAITGGFFHPRDLFPRIGPEPGTGDDCPGSNEAEMFYMLVPDPLGEVNGNVRSKADVRRGTVGVLAHEFQHLINASLRIYVNDASSFEEVWLNEGMSHIAEELVFYHASGRQPRQNITLTTLRSSTQILNAVNAYQVSNFGRVIEYLENPETRSPYANPMPTDALDDLAVRGAAWQLLRYTADRSATSQQTLWRGLANASTAGMTNFAAVFGVEFMPTVRDFVAAQYTDDVVSTTPTYQHLSWHYRSILPALLDPPNYPLRTRTLTAGAPLSVTLRGGGAAYLRFGVAGGATGTIRVTASGSAPPATLSATLIRTR